MKKLILASAVLATMASCKKISAGGNEGRLKLEENVQHYSDDEQGTVIPPDTAAAARVEVKAADSAAKKLEKPEAAHESGAQSLSAPVNNAKTDAK